MDIRKPLDFIYVFLLSIAQLESTIPLLKEVLNTRTISGKKPVINSIAFPDDGSAKRFGNMFDEFESHVICGKHRVGDARIVTIMDGDVVGKHVLIVDDLCQTGGTLYECGKALKAQGASTVSAFCAHGVFPNKSWRRFLSSGDRGIFDTFYVTNSIPPSVGPIPTDNVFEVIDIMPLIVRNIL